MLQKKSYKDQIYEQIKIKIVDRELEADHFYSEQFFADMFQVSRTPVREALLQLQSENYLEIVPNRGARIVEFTLQNLLEMCQTRDALESYAAFDLAMRIHEPGIQAQTQRLRENIERTQQKCKELGDHPLASSYAEKVMNEFQEFNLLLIEHLDNSTFKSFYDKNAGRIVALDVQAAQVVGQLEHALDGHKRILDAICAGNPSRAYMECHKHISDAYYAIENMRSKAQV